MYKRLFFLLLISSQSFSALAQFTAPSLEAVTATMKSLPDHPRLLFLKQDEALLKKQLGKDPYRENIHRAIIEESEKIISLPPVERIKIGVRLLDKSRECLRRVFMLSYAYRMTGEEKFLKRCEKELLAVSDFSDWNPSHFLDVAEMTMAVAIGYDWLFDRLSEDSKMKIRTALIEKGIQPSYNSKHNSFLRSEHNWNQVCNAGITFGVLAIAESEPELASRTIQRAVETTPKSMIHYAPDGGYPEGYGYWGYGTSFNVLLISALDVALGTDFGLSNIPGFLKTGGFLQNMIGPNRQVYNWGDSGLPAGLSPAMFWYAEKTGDETLLWKQKSFIDGSQPVGVRNRLLPTALIWGRSVNLSKIKEPKSLAWSGQGPSPVALMRTSWTDPNAIYLGFKAGSANVNHGHMDVGSFILDAYGERWAMDFGMQGYHSLESKDIKLWGRAQDAQRWKIFRYNNFVHNTLTLNNQLHKVDGYAKIDATSDTPNFLGVVSDLSKVFENEANTVKRGVAIKNKNKVIVRDELQASEKPVEVRWTLLTPATPKIIDKNTIELTQKGKTTYLKFHTETEFELKTWSTDPKTDYDEPNPGTTLVGLVTTIPAGKQQAINVVFSDSKATAVEQVPLEQWPVKTR